MRERSINNDDGYTYALTRKAKTEYAEWTWLSDCGIVHWMDMVI